ncbi:MAG: hypothetical protein IJU75_04005 [Clostridia bacterium]|nr:hypothetical protein [Clostridia bacterium]
MKRTIICLLLAALTVLLCCCGGKNDNTAEDTTVSETKPTDSGVFTEPPVSETEETPAPADYVPTVTGFELPDSSEMMSVDFALRLLSLCTGHVADLTAELFEKAGFEVRLQKYYDKPATDVSHTAAYTAGVGFAEWHGTVRPVVLIAVRGTVAGEWYSNFDVIPSRNPAAVYSENFLSAAEDILLGTQKTLSEFANPVIVVCGHSRGAACANLLGVMLDRVYPVSDVFVYTFATPATVRKSSDAGENPNIFNFINPEDFVTYLPLSAWGFSRAGNDVTLEGDENAVTALSASVAALSSVSPDVRSYYGDRHSLTSAGLSDKGMTTFELMSALVAGNLAGGGGGAPGAAAFISPESDLFTVTSALAAISGSGFAGHMPDVYAGKIARLAGEQ